jgi:hypothetical protein
MGCTVASDTEGNTFLIAGDEFGSSCGKFRVNCCWWIEGGEVEGQSVPARDRLQPGLAIGESIDIDVRVQDL